MPSIGKRRITFECLGILRATTFGTMPRKIKIMLGNAVSGRFELETLPTFGRIGGIHYLKEQCSACETTIVEFLAYIL